MPEAVAGLNILTSGIQRFSTALRNENGFAQLGLAGAGAADLFGAWKMTAAIWGLVTAGTNLNAAAVALQAAAVSLGAGGAVGDLPGKTSKAGWLAKAGELAGAVAPWRRFSLPASAGYVTDKDLDSKPHAGLESALRE